MRVDLLDVYILPRTVGEGGGNDGVKERSGDTEVAVRGQDGEGLDVEVVGLLVWWWWWGIG